MVCKGRESDFSEYFIKFFIHCQKILLDELFSKIILLGSIGFLFLRKPVFGSKNGRTDDPCKKCHRSSNNGPIKGKLGINIDQLFYNKTGYEYFLDSEIIFFSIDKIF